MVLGSRLDSNTFNKEVEGAHFLRNTTYMGHAHLALTEERERGSERDREITGGGGGNKGRTESSPLLPGLRGAEGTVH